jgi:hypothetical protein
LLAILNLIHRKEDMPVFTDHKTRMSISLPDNWLIVREGFPLPMLSGDVDVVLARSLDNVFRLNIIVGSTEGFDTLEQNQQLFEDRYAGSIHKEGTIRLDGVEHFTGVYSLGGLIHKRYVIIKGGEEYAIACAACLKTLYEFEVRAEPVFDNIVSSLKLL